MRTPLIALAVALAASLAASAQNVYRHVDENGKVTFADRPREADQKAEKRRAANVESPDARRQLDYQLSERQREEQADRMAQQRRYLSRRQQEIQAERERRLRESDPYSPPQDPYRPRARR